MEDYFDAKARLFDPDHRRAQPLRWCASTTTRAAPWPRAAPNPVTVSAEGPPRTGASRTSRSVDRGGAGVRRRRSRRRAPPAADRVCPAATTSPTVCSRWRCWTRSGCRPSRRRPGLRDARVPGSAGADRPRPGLPGAGRLRAQARRAARGAGDAARPDRRPARGGVRRGRQPRPRQAGADGPRSPPSWPTSSSSPTTTRATRIPPRSARRSWPAPRAADAPRSSRSATGARPSTTPSPGRAQGDVVLIAGKGHETGQTSHGRDPAVRRPRRAGAVARGAGLAR